MKSQTPLGRWGWILVAGWTLVVGVSLAWNLFQAQSEATSIAHHVAQTIFERDILYRRWAASHGGVYVPISPQSPPTPYLAHLPERDLLTPSGKHLTLLNPAYMTRQVYALAQEGDQVQGHLTSLNPIRPANAPDPWEEKALKAFEGKSGEVSAIVEIAGKLYMRLMRPFVTEQNCLGCHARQGYKLGDIRGGISVTVPMAPILAEQSKSPLVFGHLFLWFLGIAGIVLGTRQLDRSTADKIKAQEAAAAATMAVQTMEGMMDSVVLTDLEGKIIHANRALKDTFGWEDEVQGELIANLAVARDMPKILTDFRESLVKGYKKDLESIFITKDQKEVPVLINLSVLKDSQDTSTGAIAVIRDVSALRQAQEALTKHAALVHDLYNNAPCGYHSLDQAGTFVQINDTELTWLGYTRDEVVGRMKFSDILAPESLQTFQKSFPGFKERGWVRDLEVELVRKDGTILPVLLSATTIKDDAGHYLMSRSTVFDITERKQAEKSLQKSAEQLRYLTSQLLEVQERERKRIALELHDDLGQSLLVLRMQLNAILRRFPLESALRQTLEGAAAYLVGVIEKVRRISQDLSPSALENLGLLVALRSLFEEFQKYHDTVIEADLDEVKDILPKEAHIVIYRIAQEFLANVHKHAEATRVAVAIKALPDKVAITMEDNGKGFVPEEVQGPSNEKAGLGLVSMEERVRMLGGRFSLTSQEGEGTHLYFEISRTQEEGISGNSGATGARKPPEK